MHRILAALSFFTRLPFWRCATLTKEDYKRVVPLWPLAGWLTGGCMMLAFWLSAFVFPVPVAVMAALVVRLLITGALHEDGFADFFDGFGGGRDKDSILRIMKDSHIGTYGVVALIIYFLLFSQSLSSILSSMLSQQPGGCFSLSQTDCWANLRVAAVFLAADTFAKWASSNIINILPYARKEEEAKNKLLYDKMTMAERILGFVLGVLPAMLFLFPLMGYKVFVPMAAAVVTSGLVILYCYKKIKAYTGDCCGACFILSELVFCLALLAVI